MYDAICYTLHIALG